jgi:hypothetical protein
MISLLHPGAELRICLRKCSPHFFLFAIDIALIAPSRSFVLVPGNATDGGVLASENLLVGRCVENA